MAAAKSFQKLLCSVLTSSTFYTQLVVLKEWNREIENYGSIHQCIFCKIGVLKNLGKAVKNVCEKDSFDIQSLLFEREITVLRIIFFAEVVIRSWSERNCFQKESPILRAPWHNSSQVTDLHAQTKLFWILFSRI